MRKNKHTNTKTFLWRHHVLQLTINFLNKRYICQNIFLAREYAELCTERSNFRRGYRWLVTGQGDKNTTCQAVRYFEEIVRRRIPANTSSHRNHGSSCELSINQALKFVSAFFDLTIWNRTPGHFVFLTPWPFTGHMTTALNFDESRTICLLWRHKS